MPTPPKPFTVLSSEKKSHRTKAELSQRKQAEKALATGVPLKERPEVKNNPTAHKEFRRLNTLLKNIEKNDAIYEVIINRYCLMVAECDGFEKKRESFSKNIEDLRDSRSGMEDEDYFRLQANMQKTIINIDKQLQSKRKMLLDMEKENIMTIASAMRSIPKKQESHTNELMKILGGSG